jgi:hypothetical protein
MKQESQMKSFVEAYETLTFILNDKINFWVLMMF